MIDTLKKVFSSSKEDDMSSANRHEAQLADAKREVCTLKSIAELQEEKDAKENTLRELEKKESKYSETFKELNEKCLRLGKEKEKLEGVIQIDVCSTKRFGGKFLLNLRSKKEKIPASYLCPSKGIPSQQELPMVNDDEIIWAFTSSRQGKVIVERNLEELARSIFIVGDVHGDFETLYTVVSRCLDKEPECIFVFQGDLVDRGKDSLSCVRLVCWLAKKLPNRVLWLKGNHDTLRYDELAGKFSSDSNPQEFADELNNKSQLKQEGICIAKIMKSLPLGCILGETWISHGGVILSDELETFKGFEFLSENAENDLMWVRMVDQKSKLLNRSSKGCDAGYEQAQLFVSKINDALNVEIKHLIFAHQHLADNIPTEINGSLLLKDIGDSIRGGYMEYKKYYGENVGLTCQMLKSFREENILPTILQWQNDFEMPAPIYVN